MTQPDSPTRTPEGVDAFLDALLAPDDDALAAALETSDAEGLPAIAVSATHGKLLALLTRAIAARRALEIGTLGGYSAIRIARGLAPGGRLVTLEFDPHHADVARRNVDRAGLAGVVDVRVGSALDTLPTLAGGDPFDLVFIDADKVTYPQYLEWAIRLTRPGALIIADNVVRRGGVADPGGDSASAGVRAYLEAVAGDPRVDGTAVQTVGVKGWDGFSLALRS
jgi:predicted O-methyltransferase YrrM